MNWLGETGDAPLGLCVGAQSATPHAHIGGLHPTAAMRERSTGGERAARKEKRTTSRIKAGCGSERKLEITFVVGLALCRQGREASFLPQRWSLKGRAAQRRYRGSWLAPETCVVSGASGVEEQTQRTDKQITATSCHSAPAARNVEWSSPDRVSRQSPAACPPAAGSAAVCGCK